MSDTPLETAARRLSAALAPMRFSAPVSHVYNPFDYAWAGNVAYLRRFGQGPKRVVFVGMNPGPFGMVQTGVPFGEVAAVRDWMGIEAEITPPAEQNPKRPIEGFACTRSEVSGRRLWGLFAERFGDAQNFFAEHFVANYCPLAFFDHGRNVTPDKLPAHEAAPLYAACDEHLRDLVTSVHAEWVIGIGNWAEKRSSEALAGLPGLKFGRVEQDVEDIAVDEEILAEDARGVEVQLREQGADFENHPNIEYTEYIYDMADRMAAADLIVCRAGAATLGELCMLGRPALLVPSPYVAENHQEKNARALEKEGGCRVLLEKDANPQVLYDEIQDLLSDRDRLHRMGHDATKLAAHDASEKIYQEILWAIENHGKK